MRSRVLIALALLAAAGAVGHAQPPTAPAPRAVAKPPEIDNLTFRYTLRKAAAVSLPDLEIAVVGSRAEVRWTEGATAYTLTAPRVVMRGGSISAIGSQANPADLRSTRPRAVGTDLTVFGGRRIVVDITTGTIDVEDARGGLTAPNGR